MQRKRTRGAGALRGLEADAGEHELYTLMLLNGALSESEVDWTEYLEAIEEAGEELGRVARTFSRIRELSRRWQFDLVSLLESLSRGQRGPLASYMRRMARSLKVGTRLRDFLRVEYLNQMSNRVRRLERGSERVRRAVDAYSAISSSSLFIFVTLIMGFGVLGGGNPSVLVLLMLAVFLSVSVALARVTTKALPDLRLLYAGPDPPEAVWRHERLTTVLSLLAVPMASAVVLLPLAGAPLWSSYLLVLAIGVAYYAISRTAKGLLRHVELLNSELPALTKALADVTSSTGSLREGVRALLGGKWDKAGRFLRRLEARLSAGIDIEAAWRLFLRELGSEMGRVHLSLLLTAYKVGANLNHTSAVLLDSMSYWDEVRKRRASLAGYAKGIIAPVQGAVTGVSALIAGIVDLYAKISEMVRRAGSVPGLPAVPFMSGLEALSGMSHVMPLLALAFSVSLALANSLLVYSVEGGTRHALVSSLAIMLVVTGGAGLFSSLASGAMGSLVSGWVR